jgi:membrane-associated protease RseP (regulator of RpoE activity)
MLNKIKLMFRLYRYRLNNGIPYRYRHLNNENIYIPEIDESVEEIFPRPQAEPEKKKPWLNIVLFITTFITTTLAGAHSGNTIAEFLISGLPYSVTLMLILGTHEMGHYLAAKKFGVDATLPFFIPFPSIVGTMGAVIKTRTPIPHTKALFYIGVMGPIPGFVVSLAASVIGIYLSQVQPLPELTGMGLVPIFGDSLLYGTIVYIFHGAIPAGQDIFLHPLAWAGWIGFLVTSLNLIPIGQLDGGHILYSLIGRKQVYAGWAAFAALVVLSFFWPGWIVWIILSLLILMIAHPPVPLYTPLTTVEKITGWACMVILALTFIPVPVDFL